MNPECQSLHYQTIHKYDLSMQMDSKLPMDIFETVMQLATEGCKAVANYIHEVRRVLLDCGDIHELFFA